MNCSVFWCWYVMSRCDLDLWPLDLELLQHFRCYAFKLCTKFELNRIIHGWVIDDLAPFRACNFRGWGTFTERFLGVRGGNCTKLGEDIGRLWLQNKFVFRVWTSCCIFKRGRLRVEWYWKRREMSHFLWKLRERWARSLYELLKLYLRPNLRNAFDGRPLHGC